MNSLCRRFACIAILLFATTVGLASPLPDLSGKVVGVHDGDTITLLTTDKTQVKVRLEGIDVPELNQDFGNAAKKALSELVFGQQVVVHQKGLDRYKRTLGRVFVGATDANLEVVRLGLAWRYDKYSNEAALLRAQNEARDARRGLWAAPNPIPPWEWRKAK